MNCADKLERVDGNSVLWTSFYSFFVNTWHMANLRNCSREFLSEFIELYQNFPCLWRIKSKEYCNRDKNRTAYEKLIEKYKEIDVQANRETVVKKINEWDIDVFYF